MPRQRLPMIALALAVVGLLRATAATLSSGWVFGDVAMVAWIAATALSLWAPSSGPPPEPR